jgi:glycine/D-amino acid oxidase-like deaminating enzyme
VADRVILAMNAWSLAIAELRSGILVITSDDVVTPPVPEFLDRHRWRSGPILTDSSVFVSGCRTTRDGRIVAGVTGGAIGRGSMRNQRFEGRTPRERDIMAALGVFFSGGETLPIASSWRGPIDRTRFGLPLYGRLPGEDNILFGYGFSGNGIVGCHLGGRILSSLALGRSDEWSASRLIGPPERWMPPEPARTAGAHLVRWAVRRKDRYDAEGRTPDWITGRIAGLAPGGIVTTRKPGS